MIDYDAWRFWREVVVLGIVAANFVYTWWVNREKVTAKRFAALEQQVAERLSAARHEEMEAENSAECRSHRDRTAQIAQEVHRIDNELRHLPNHNDIGRIHARMDELNGALREMIGGMKALNNSVALINEHLLSQGNKR